LPFCSYEEQFFLPHFKINILHSTVFEHPVAWVDHLIYILWRVTPLNTPFRLFNPLFHNITLTIIQSAVSHLHSLQSYTPIFCRELSVSVSDRKLCELSLQTLWTLRTLITNSSRYSCNGGDITLAQTAQKTVPSHIVAFVSLLGNRHVIPTLRFHWRSSLPSNEQ
jgi:hypothetical protein